MKVVSTLASGVLKTALIAVASTPFFVLASESPVQVESRESAVLPFREPIEEEKQPFGFEHQYQMHAKVSCPPSNVHLHYPQRSVL